MPRLLSIGEIMVELAPADGGLHRMGFAGDTFNTAWYARRLLPSDWSVGYVTALGTDAVSDDMAAFMAREGIDTSAVAQVPDRTVGLYLIMLKDGERSFSYWRGQSAARTLADDPARLDAALAGAEVIHFSGITLAILSEAARSGLCAALARARAQGAHLAFDTNMRPRLWASPAAMCAGLMLGAAVADTVLPSFDEEQAAFGDADPDATIARYRAAGARTVIVKNGGGTVTAWEGDGGTGETVTVTPRPVQVVDSTAAGDSFAAAYLAARASGAGLRDAVERACALAAAVVQKRGALAPELFGPDISGEDKA